jgi:redox-sensing transcriptional repressor
MIKIPVPVAERLPIYYEYIISLEDTAFVSSNMIAKYLGFTPSTIRQDFMFLKKLASSTNGYEISSLKYSLEEILGITTGANMAITGVGSLGLALAHSRQFIEKNFIIRALFDKRPEIIGSVIDGIPVYPVDVMKEVVELEKITIGIIATPATVAQEAADALVDSGIKGIWNFTAVSLKLPGHIEIENVNIMPSLFKLSLLMKTDVL